MIFPATDKLGQCIIFVRSREAARHLHDRMKGAGYTCTSIQGDMQHEDRDRVVQEFREGKTRILIATDVLSRGFDHSNVTLVINYHPPLARDNVRPAFETYMHRIGRSGRFGRKGAAFNLTGDDRERRHVELIAQHFNHPIQGVQWDDEEAFEKARGRLPAACLSAYPPCLPCLHVAPRGGAAGGLCVPLLAVAEALLFGGGIARAQVLVDAGLSSGE